MRARTIALVAALGYAAFLVATIPASVVAARVESATQGNVKLLEPRGTLWNGSARATVAQATGTAQVDRIEWRFALGDLAAARIAFDVGVTSRGFEASARLGRGLREWTASASRVKLDAPALAAWAPMLAAWRPEGRIGFACDSLAWDDQGRATGKGRLTWDDAAVSLSEVRPLGRYALDISADHGPATLVLSTLDGPLRLSGRGSIAPARLTFSGEARGEGPNAAALDPLLNLMGLKRADGSRAIEVGISL